MNSELPPSEVVRKLTVVGSFVIGLALAISGIIICAIKNVPVEVWVSILWSAFGLFLICMSGIMDIRNRLEQLERHQQQSAPPNR